MIDRINSLIKEAQNFTTTSLSEVEDFRIRFLGKKGVLNKLFADFKTVANTEKKAYGQAVNELKSTIQDKVNALNSSLNQGQNVKREFIDFSRPGDPFTVGGRHPISLVKNQIIDIFSRIGFNISEGPEIEDDWHNFTALNLPEHHPARDMQDTFFIQTDPDILLRTHTSSVQVRYMEN
ncbi:MAG: phenylalanine--tRNA ligase subunit alpha, partial [Bacteroidota bacterium]|nr:phenylalanine--tRNA ligase subunit alpha [Bacteroidota bacterium]